MSVLKALLLCVAASHFTQVFALQTCDRNYLKIGCYDEYYASKDDLVLNERDGVKWGNIVAFMHHLACKCSDTVKKANEKRASKGNEAYVGFALHYWGECYGKTKSQVDALMDTTRSHRCTGSQDYNGCFDSHTECVGHENAEYVYMLPSKKEENVDGGYSEWMEWTKCNGECGKGFKVRERTCTNPMPKGEGKDCSSLGNGTEMAACDTGKPCPVDGEYGAWGEFNACTKSCGGGVQTRSRLCNSPAPSHGGMNCQGPATETQSCNIDSCPVDGKYGPWSAFGSCTRSCGGGVKTRSRACNNPAPSHGGMDCQGPAAETQSCNIESCPVDGKYGPWSAFGSCKSSGGGVRTRSRLCNSPAPSHGGMDCQGPATDTESCNIEVYPVDGKYGPWSAFGSCTRSCGGGVKTRSRACNNPSPKHGGKDCQGAASETRSCNTNLCPVNGGYSGWGRYGSCSRTCGGGQKTRRRTCTNPAPAYGGRGCSGPSTQTASCNTRVCLSAEYRRWKCQGRTLKLRCKGRSVIHITHALYGRKTTSICKGLLSFAWNKKCGARCSWSKVRAACEGKRSCSVSARNRVFGNPCRGTKKYLEVKYRCRG